MINRVLPPIGGATGRLLFELSSALSEKGYDITILTTSQKSSTQRDLNGIEVVNVIAPGNPRSRFNNIVICFKLFFKALVIDRPDLIITKTDPPFFVIFGALLAFLKRAKHIHWCQDLYPDILPALEYKTSSLSYRIMNALSVFAMKRCKMIVTIGACMRHNINKKGIAGEKIKIIPNWYDSILKKESGAQKPSELPSKFRILYAGNMGRAHPPETILDAAEILNETDPDIEFLFVGNSARLQQLAKERGRKGLDNIRILPFQPRRKLRALLESGDIHLISMSDKALGCMLPSRIYDIFYVQRPCIFIGPEASDLSLILEKFEAGLTIPQDDGKILANAIKHLRDYGEDWHTLYKGAGKAAHAFTPERSFELWDNLIKEI